MHLRKSKNFEGILKSGSVVWFTGLPCSGKSTLLSLLQEGLRKQGVDSELFDGDIFRQYLTKGLNFSKEDRMENAQRIAYVANILARHGILVIVAAILPYQELRNIIRKEVKNYIEVFTDCPLEVCEARDKKGMYKKARIGKIQHFTGVSDPYEVPTNPDLILKTSEESESHSLLRIMKFLTKNGYISNSP